MHIPLEIYENFRSYAEWEKWSKDRHYIYSKDHSSEVISRILASGIREPLTGDIIHPADIKIVGDNHRESIKAGKLISRHRGLLMELEALSKAAGGVLLSRRSKIYAPEALTDFALFLRGNFPRFVGSEYAETTDDRDSLWPILSEDLTKLSFEDGVFDLVISNEVFEHVHDLGAALRQINRVLTNQGVLISTFPFAFGKKRGEIKAKLIDGRIKLLAAPEYHGNPMDPTKGSLVFEIPGWDLIERAKKSGFDDAYFSFICSARCGVIGKDINGIFVFVARRNIASQRFVVNKLTAQHRDADGRSVEKINVPTVDEGVDSESTDSRNHVLEPMVAALVGLPRSGTTVFAAAIGAHPAVKPVFEPWNAEKNRLPPIDLTVKKFMDRFGVKLSHEQRLLFVKETAANLAYLDAIDFILSDRVNGKSAKLIWLFRDPIHTFLSEINARKDWWGEPDLEVTAETFSKWARRSLRALQKISSMCASHHVLCIEYNAFVTNPKDVLKSVMKFLGLDFMKCQIDYFKSLNKSEVRGDINVATDPKKISQDSILKRDKELGKVIEIISESPYFEEISRVQIAGREILAGNLPSVVTTKSFVKSVSCILVETKFD